MKSLVSKNSGRKKCTWARKLERSRDQFSRVRCGLASCDAAAPAGLSGLRVVIMSWRLAPERPRIALGGAALLPPMPPPVA
jgi:hypothetical protein